MIGIDLYRNRIGSFLPSMQKTNKKFRRMNIGGNNGKTGKRIKCGLLLRLLLFISVMVATNEGFRQDKLFENVIKSNLNIPAAGGETSLHWRKLITTSKDQTTNKRAKILHGNIKRGIINMHVNIRSLYNKMSEVKNLIQKQKPHILGISEANLKKVTTVQVLLRYQAIILFYQNLGKYMERQEL